MKKLLYTILICTGLAATPITNTNAIALTTVGAYTASYAASLGVRAALLAVPLAAQMLGARIAQSSFFKPSSDDFDWTKNSGTLRTDTFFYRVKQPVAHILAMQTIQSGIAGIGFVASHYKDIKSPLTFASHARKAFAPKDLAGNLATTTASHLIARRLSCGFSQWAANDEVVQDAISAETLSTVTNLLETFLRSELHSAVTAIRERY